MAERAQEIEAIVAAREAGDWPALNRASWARLWRLWSEGGSPTMAIFSAHGLASCSAAQAKHDAALLQAVRSGGYGYARFWARSVGEAPVVCPGAACLWVYGMDVARALAVAARWTQGVMVHAGSERAGQVGLYAGGREVGVVDASSPDEVAAFFSRAWGHAVVFQWEPLSFMEKMMAVQYRRRCR